MFIAYALHYDLHKVLSYCHNIRCVNNCYFEKSQGRSLHWLYSYVRMKWVDGNKNGHANAQLHRHTHGKQTHNTQGKYTDTFSWNQELSREIFLFNKCRLKCNFIFAKMCGGVCLWVSSELVSNASVLQSLQPLDSHSSGCCWF